MLFMNNSLLKQSDTRQLWTTSELGSLLWFRLPVEISPPYTHYQATLFCSEVLILFKLVQNYICTCARVIWAQLPDANIRMYIVRYKKVSPNFAYWYFCQIL